IYFVKEYNSQNSTQYNYTDQNINASSLGDDYLNMQVYFLVGIIITISAIDAVLAVQRLWYHKK
ncbi:MAG: hypothetical protein ACP5UL_06470, partial [Thermoplasmata archaeon]